jgi:hypothetical protein
MIQDFPQGLLSFGLIMAGSIIILSASIAYALWAEVRRRFPTPTTLRICTTCLTQEGVRDTTPDGEKLYRWSSIRSIREHGGDIHFWRWLDGLFIPREAWKDNKECEGFYQAALILWESDGDLWPD